jgi:hypothetical protein
VSPGLAQRLQRLLLVPYTGVGLMCLGTDRARRPISAFFLQPAQAIDKVAIPGYSGGLTRSNSCQSRKKPLNRSGASAV